MTPPLNPGIRQTVVLLNRHGFPTCDSGDGQTHDHNCDRGQPYVVIQLANPAALVYEAERLQKILEALNIDVGPVGQGEVWIQANFDPFNQLAFLDVTGLHDEMLPEAD